ncbi:MAG: biotin/lipoyl-binding protein, partial [Planctomycetota bacterium]
MTRRAMVTVGVATLAVVGAALGAWRSLGSGEANPTRGQAARAASVEVAPVEVGDIELRRVLSGTIASPVTFDIAPKVAGRVFEIKVEAGDRVERGQVVAVLDDDEYRLEVKQANADLKMAEASLAEARSAIEIGRRERERVRTLR